jgi:hypothetical protein
MSAPINVLKTNTELLNEIDAEIVRLENAIAKAPQGRVNCRTLSDKKVHFYRRIEGRSDEYLGKDKESLLQALAQKRYDEGYLGILLREKANLTKAVQNLKRSSPRLTRDQLWAEFPEELKKYVTQNTTTNTGYVHWWRNRTCNIKNKEPIGNFYSARGEHVRSKSEIVIADRLLSAGLEYYYELFYSPNYADFFYPDFTILHPTTYETWYWEHCGMIDKTSYSSELMFRLELYGGVGIYPGKNLIITFESSQRPLNTQYVDNLIKEFFLKSREQKQ